MKRVLVTFLVGLTCLQMVSAQDAVNAIRKDYADAMEKVKTMAEWEKEGEPPYPQYYQVYAIQNLPGTGKHEEVTRMYFHEVENDYGMLAGRTLHFATFKYNYAAREFYEEYLYDEKGKIEFIYARNADVDDFKGGEFRLYFKDGRLIKSMLSVYNETTKKYEQTHTGVTLPAQYGDEYKGYVHRAEKLLKLFDTIEEDMYHQTD